jgi:hypothetical protein
MKITKHAAQRGNERLGLTNDSFVKLSAKALKKGIKHCDCKGQLKKYIDALYLKHKTANNIRIYGEFVYLFCNEILITVFQLPVEFKKVIIKMKQRCA